MTNLSEMNIYENIRTTVTEAQEKVCATVNFVMVETYWNIGKQICDAQGKNERAEYGTGLLKYLSEKLTDEFGKGFTLTNYYQRLLSSQDQESVRTEIQKLEKGMDAKDIIRDPYVLEFSRP